MISRVMFGMCIGTWTTRRTQQLTSYNRTIGTLDGCYSEYGVKHSGNEVPAASA